MHYQTLTLNPHTPTSNYGPRFSHPFIQNPRLRTTQFFKTNYFSNHVIKGYHVPVTCRVEAYVSDNRCVFPFNFHGDKEFDVATLGNLCVDVVLNVPKLPPSSFDERKSYMEQLSKSPPDKVY